MNENVDEISFDDDNNNDGHEEPAETLEFYSKVSLCIARILTVIQFTLILPKLPTIYSDQYLDVSMCSMRSYCRPTVVVSLAVTYFLAIDFYDSRCNALSEKETWNFKARLFRHINLNKLYKEYNTRESRSRTIAITQTSDDRIAGCQGKTGLVAVFCIGARQRQYYAMHLLHLQSLHGHLQYRQR
jgi:hypothetical protein